MKPHASFFGTQALTRLVGFQCSARLLLSHLKWSRTSGLPWTPPCLALAVPSRDMADNCGFLILLSMNPPCRVTKIRSDIKGNQSVRGLTLPLPRFTSALMRSLFKSRKAPSPNEDVLEQLANYEVIILMDDSMSMRGKRWKQVCIVFFRTRDGS